MRPETQAIDLDHYFEYSSKGIKVVENGLQQLNFGEYLVSLHAITRHDLFRALQLQDQDPGVPIGQCLAKLGALGSSDIEKHLGSWNKVAIVEA